MQTRMEFDARTPTSEFDLDELRQRVIWGMRDGRILGKELEKMKSGLKFLFPHWE